MPAPNPTKRESRLLVGVFVVALLAHAWFATRNLSTGFMARHEFRQSLTATIAYHLERQENFSLLYETPILGKPWVSVLLEVPIYEWSVVLFSRATGVTHVVAARTISLACFYLILPALYLLLGRFGVPPAKRLLTLALVLTCPVYIFYSRAFLMESMEVMCCAWFLYGFVQMMDQRRWHWFALATVAGTGAALIKSVTFAVWLLPAAGYGAWMLWRDLRARAGWGVPLATMFWGLAGVAIPLTALRLWINLTDPIKELHASAVFLTSKNLSQGNWGITEVAARFSAKTWGVLADRWQEGLMPPWLLLLVLAAGLALLPRVRRPVLGLAAVFFAAQFMFPFAYAYQDYYYYACAVFLLAAFGFILNGLLESGLPRWAGWLAVVGVLGVQFNTYRTDYYLHQLVKSTGGFSFTEALRDTLPEDAVIVVSGSDWNPTIPYYTQRKALLIRSGLERDEAYQKRAFADLGGEDVAALVLVGDQRANLDLVNLAVATFDLEKAPTFSGPIADVYCGVRYGSGIRAKLLLRSNYWDLVPSPAPAVTPLHGAFRITRDRARDSFAMVSPAPLRGNFMFGFSPVPVEGAEALLAHPESHLWLRAPGAATRIEWDFGLLPVAYEQAGDRTDGVEFVITGLLPGGEKRVIFRRYLDPVNQPADRGGQHASIVYEPRAGELLHFASMPGQSLSYDWSYWKRIEVK